MKEEILAADGKLEHDIFKQLIKFQNTLRDIMGENLITHQEFVDTL